MPARADDPALSDVLRALAESGPHEAAAKRLGLAPERLAEYLREAADAVAFPIPKVRRAAPTATVAAAPTSVEPAAPAKHALVKVYSDGAARGNPGPAGAGAVVKAADGRIVARVGKFLGTQTNNVAEYEGLIIGLQKALDLGAREVQVFADSLLVISQLKGEWKLKHPGLKALFGRAQELLAKFDRVSLQHVRRELNGDADEMSNRAIDERMPG